MHIFLELQDFQLWPDWEDVIENVYILYTEAQYIDNK